MLQPHETEGAGAGEREYCCGMRGGEGVLGWAGRRVKGPGTGNVELMQRTGSERRGRSGVAAVFLKPAGAGRGLHTAAGADLHTSPPFSRRPARPDNAVQHVQRQPGNRRLPLTREACRGSSASAAKEACRQPGLPARVI